MNETETESTTSKVRLKKDGTLVQKIDGADVVIARYSQTTGRLEFETKEYATKFYQQATACIGSSSKGTEQSGRIIKSIGVKGDKLPDKDIPKRPRMGELGDATPEVVEWYFAHNLPEAIIRYGVFTDSLGVPIRKDVRRVIENTVDNRDQDDSQLEWVKTGAKTQDKSPVARSAEVVTAKKQIIARRATAMTFTPNEVVGGFQLDDDGNADEEGNE